MNIEQAITSLGDALHSDKMSWDIAPIPFTEEAVGDIMAKYQLSHDEARHVIIRHNTRAQFAASIKYINIPNVSVMPLVSRAVEIWYEI